MKRLLILVLLGVFLVGAMGLVSSGACTNGCIIDGPESCDCENADWYDEDDGLWCMKGENNIRGDQHTKPECCGNYDHWCNVEGDGFCDSGETGADCFEEGWITVFEDDFEDGGIDENKWYVNLYEGVAIEDNGILALTSTSGTAPYLANKNSLPKSKKMRINFTAKYPALDDNGFGVVFLDGCHNAVGSLWADSGINGKVFYSTFPGGQYSSANTYQKINTPQEGWHEYIFTRWNQIYKAESSAGECSKTMDSLCGNGPSFFIGHHVDGVDYSDWGWSQLYVGRVKVECYSEPEGIVADGWDNDCDGIVDNNLCPLDCSSIDCGQGICGTDCVNTGTYCENSNLTCSPEGTCVSLGNPYWTDMNDQKIIQSQVGDTLKMVVAGVDVLSHDVNFTLKIKNEPSTIWDRLLSFFGIEGASMNSMASNLYTIKNNSDHKFFVSISTLGIEDESDWLDVSSGENDPISLDIISPFCGENFTESSEFDIVVNASDADDLIQGNITIAGTKIVDLTNGINSVAHRIDSDGEYTIKAEISNTRGEYVVKTTNIMITGTTGNYTAACIDSPEPGKYFQSSSVNFTATSSKAIECLGGVCDFVDLTSNKLLFSWAFPLEPSINFEKLGDGTNISGSTFLTNPADFTMEFVSSGYHPATLDLSFY